jgi:hypothetical protein
MGSVAANISDSTPLVFSGFDAWHSHIALPVPHGTMGLTCVWVKNNQLASAKPIYNVRTKAEYLHNANPEFNLQTACFWYKPFKVPGPITWQERVDLEANESQAIPVFMDPVSATALDPPWPQSAMDEHRATRSLRPGRWTIRITITADGTPPLVGEIEFTVYQQPGQDNLSIGCHAGMGAVRLPLVPDPPPQKGWLHLDAIWRWVGGKWQWAPISAAAATFIKFGEYTIGLFVLALSAFAVVSKISHWKTDDVKRTRLVRGFGYLVVVGAFIFFSILATRIKGSEPWSHLSLAAKPAPAAAKSAADMAAQQRPYVWVDKVVAKSPVVGQPLVMDVYFVNYGKSPASEVATFVHVDSGRPADRICGNFRQDLEEKGPGVLGPGKSDLWKTAVSVADPTAKQSTVKNWDGKMPIIAYGRMFYADFSGNHYRSTFCVEMLDGVTPMFVVGKNEAK